ncbi:hypothetical protein [Methylobacterium isbiliense]|uniref:Endonuclease/exonuclease/phosphatase domain-containing protein n=1 Tax=Methylobacterium isbiliense TaxID=315478 RepID=A0ABQ4SKK0_9HYPH|nr:hypothetical protein [Methylobacterium isbiliense]MDN3627537.1 hypothetical protein [Methylobacterium isbiliense]GJE03746.1 hypothetical protein GMJLKIPL_5703 [Methylobacterium isbiliense]
MKPRYIHIGSWNIEHFGRADDSPENQFAIAEHIELSGVHVLALQEMYATNDISDPSIPVENSFLRAALDLVEDHTGCRWDYEIFRNRSMLDTSQLCGVAWNTARVEKRGEAFRLAVPAKVNEEGITLSLWDRTPHAVKFAARPGGDELLRLTDFIVIPLHMKSNVGQRHIVMRTRAHEARTLVEQLPAVEAQFGSKKDVILLGDTNCKTRGEKAIQAFIDGGFEDLNEDDVPTYAIGNDAPFDRIFVPRGPDRKTFWFSRQYIMRSASPLAHDRYLSDHFLIKTSIVVRRDDDH